MIPVVDGVVIVDRPALAPGRCIATLSDEDPNGFIDTLLTETLLEGRVYVSVSWILEMGKKFGLADPDGDNDLSAVLRERDLLREQVAEMDKQLDAIDTLESSGYQTRKRRGRPPKKTEE